MARVVTSADLGPVARRVLTDLAKAGGSGIVEAFPYPTVGRELEPSGLVIAHNVHGVPIVALTWAGWNAVPRMFAEQAARAADLSVATWLDYVGRGTAGAPAPDGYAVPPGTPATAPIGRPHRPERFWWPWTVQNWVADRNSAPGRRVGERQCSELHPTNPAATCKAAIGADGTCTNGHRQRAAS